MVRFYIFNGGWFSFVLTYRYELQWLQRENWSQLSLLLNALTNNDKVHWVCLSSSNAEVWDTWLKWTMLECSSYMLNYNVEKVWLSLTVYEGHPKTLNYLQNFKIFNLQTHSNVRDALWQKILITLWSEKLPVQLA